MRLKKDGFTLLELMVVLTIIGILAALITPKVINGIQYGKQIGTMREIKSIVDACLEYASQHNEAPAAGVQDGPLSPDSVFVKALTEKIMTSCPTNDKWGNSFIVYSGMAAAHFPGFNANNVSNADIIIISCGRKGQQESFTFDFDRREAGLFESKKMEDYDKNLINWNGTWIRAPKS